MCRSRPPVVLQLAWRVIHVVPTSSVLSPAQRSPSCSPSEAPTRPLAIPVRKHAASYLLFFV